MIKKLRIATSAGCWKIYMAGQDPVNFAAEDPLHEIVQWLEASYPEMDTVERCLIALKLAQYVVLCRKEV